MQAQDAPTAYLLKAWAWAEANRNRLIAGIGVIIAIIFVFSYFSWQRGQKETAAAEALTQFVLTTPPDTAPSQVAAGFFRIASEYPDSQTGPRAQLNGAAALFKANQFSEAQAAFQKYLDAHPDGAFAATATLGVAACLEAQNKLDLAAGTYQQVINGFSDPAASINARFGLARVYEMQGKATEAMNSYSDIARMAPNSPFAQEAQIHAIELRSKMVSAPPVGGKPGL